MHNPQNLHNLMDNSGQNRAVINSNELIMLIELTTQPPMVCSVSLQNKKEVASAQDSER